MELTRAEAIQKCRDMWSWIADETEKLGRIVKKEEYFLEHDLEEPENDCYLCEYTLQGDAGGCVECYMCPLDFGVDTIYACENPVTPYKKWWYAITNMEEYTLEEIAGFARQVANLPEREETL